MVHKVFHFYVISWACKWQNQQNDLCIQWRLRSAWASAQSDQSLLWALLGQQGPKLSSCGQQRLWSDWADLSLRWAQRSICWFCHGVAQLLMFSSKHSVGDLSKSTILKAVFQIFHLIQHTRDLNTDLHPEELNNLFEPQNDKTNKITCAPSEDLDQPGRLPSLIKVIAVRMEKPCVLSHLLSKSEDSDQTGPSLGAQVVWLVLLCCGSKICPIIPTVICTNSNESMIRWGANNFYTMATLSYI